MKRSILAAAIAGLFTVSAGAAALWAVQPPPPPDAMDSPAMEAQPGGHAAHGAAAGGDYYGCDECGACDECFGLGTHLGLIHAEFEGLGWWRKARSLPPLVTTRVPGVPEANAGALNLPTTRILFGGDSHTDIEAGGRINLGFLGRDRMWGAGGDFFFLGDNSTEFAHTASNINEILAIPFFDVANNAEGRLAVNYPGFATNGRVAIDSTNEAIGANAYGRYLIWAEENLRIDGIAGYQFARIDDSLLIHANFDDLTGIPNANLDVTDIFDAENEFHGGTLGVMTEWYYGNFIIRGMAKVALGNMHQSVSVRGATTTTPAGGLPPATTAQGLFTQPSNIGLYERDEFAVVPEARINVGYRLSQHWTASLGYTFIYFSDVALAANTLDRNVDVRQIPPLNQVATQPAFSFGNQTDFWLQGFNLSLEFAY